MYRQAYEIIKRADPAVKEEDVKVFDEGWDYFVILVKDLVYRIPRAKDAEAKLEREINFLREFRTESGVETPSYELRYDVLTRFTTHKFIRGSDLTEQLFVDLEDTDREKIAWQLGTFLKDIHSFSIKKAEKLGLPHQEELDRTRTFFAHKLKDFETVVFPHLTEKEIRWAKKIFSEFDKNIQNAPITPRVIHGDIHSRHVLISLDRKVISGIIDFGDICIGDPAYDFQMFGLFEKDFLQKIYQSYQLQRDETFEIRRKFYQDILLLRQMKWAVSFKEKNKLEELKVELANYFEQNCEI